MMIGAKLLNKGNKKLLARGGGGEPGNTGDRGVSG